MTITPATRRELHRLLVDIVDLDAVPYGALSLGEVARRATKLLPRLADRRAPRKKIPKRTGRAAERRAGRRP